jgi:hypothetical protein
MWNWSYPSELLSLLKKTIPDWYPNSSPFAGTTTASQSDVRSGHIGLQVRLLRRFAIRSHNQKLAGLLFLAVSLGHGLARVLELRCIRGGQLRSDGHPFLKHLPPYLAAGLVLLGRLVHLEAAFILSANLRTSNDHSSLMHPRQRIRNRDF